MRKVITSRDIEALQTTGGDLASLPVDALYTPSAKDALNALGITPAGKTSVGASPSSEPAQPPAERQVTNIESFFNSPEINLLKEKICDIGRRLWPTVRESLQRYR